MFLSIGKRIARLSTDYPMLHTADEHKLKKTDTAVAKLFTKLAGVTTASYLWFETKYHEKQKRSISYKDNG